MKARLQKLWNFKPFRVFVWNTFNGAITLLLTYLATLADPRFVVIAPFVMSGLSVLTKYINTMYFGDL